MLETFYTEQQYYIHFKISRYVEGPQSKVESGGIRTRMGKHLRGVGGARRAPTGKFEFFRCPEMNHGRRGGEAKGPFPTPNISAVPEAI